MTEDRLAEYKEWAAFRWTPGVREVMRELIAEVERLQFELQQMKEREERIRAAVEGAYPPFAV